MDRERKGFEVRGRVQGVGFRWWTARTARELDLAGWVRNRPDGAVEVQAEGEPDALDRLERALRAGPSSARVTEVREIPPAEWLDADGFDIRG